jgi:CRISPR system Cascade subunit CasD
VTAFLTFTLYAPLASWGEVAVGEVRDSLDRPTRSGVLGVVAAALGLDRGDDDGHRALHDGYGTAVLVLESGRAMRDYHTIQTATAGFVKRHQPPTRRALLAASESETKTTLSTRTLRQDHLAVVAIWARSGSRWTLRDLAAALRAPHFVLYAGRKSNPFGLPMAPELTEGPTLGAALQQARERLRLRCRAVAPELVPKAGTWAGDVYHDDLRADGVPDGQLQPRRQVNQRDGVVSRARWQFAERRVFVSHLPEASS